MPETGSQETKPAKRKLNISPEERKRRSDAAKQRIAEGKMGGKFGKLGGRPKKPKATDLLAEEAEKHKNEMLAALKDALDPSQSINTRLKAVDQWLGIERESHRMEIAEDEHFAKMSRADLASGLAEKFASNPLLMEIVLKRINGEVIEGEAEDEEVADAEVVDDDDAA